MLLCSPHNPGGMVWKREELEALAQSCDRHNILMVSDEIHADLLFDGQVHTPYAMVSESAAQNSVICMAPSKTFNVAGLSTSVVIIPNPEIRKKFDKLMQTLHINMGNIPGAVALEAAYTHGDEWLGQMMGYAQDNYRYLEEQSAKNLPHVRVMTPEATSPVWSDCRVNGLKD